MAFDTPDSVVLESKPCPMGCASRDELVLQGRDRLHDLAGTYSVVRCSECGLLRTNPRPTADTIGYYYPEDYGPYAGTRITDSGFRTGISAVKEFVRNALRIHSLSLPPLESGRMLEIGCASGAFLARMAGKGWQVEGIEFSPTAAKNAQEAGFSVHCGSLESAPEPIRQFDLVVGWMVLEHLHDPVLALDKLHRWTRKDGWLAISVPNAACFQLDWFRQRWFPLHLPAHLYHFTPETLEALLNATGWRIEKIHYQRVMTDLVASAAYLIEDRWPNSSISRFLKRYPGIFNLPLYPLALLLSWFGQTARMTVWARRINK
ncbi:class I SAM-dependent methyltransferase [Methylocaldum sp.]|uniref:class I SAM-dependent methyltransferase n=1 Tax=Methylocaldum sp. TaxID=1969727 RepID=UPI002D2BAB67|nr:class I SAM-dependent methyltransferase [Methylocaldum sp.]HYE35045.1 class I SAM-dependent methyltransferase [Methylocaldum sp.]